MLQALTLDTSLFLSRLAHDSVTEGSQARDASGRQRQGALLQATAGVHVSLSRRYAVGTQPNLAIGACRMKSRGMHTTR